MAELDLDRLARFLAIAGGSQHDGEAVNAWRLAFRVLQTAGMTVADLIEVIRQATLAAEAAKILVAENASLRSELEQLRTESVNGTAVATWTDVGAAITSSRAAAAWALELHRQSLCWLSPFETDFLQTVTGWTGRLTSKQEPIFRRILDRVAARTGMQPPP